MREIDNLRESPRSTESPKVTAEEWIRENIFLPPTAVYTPEQIAASFREVLQYKAADFPEAKEAFLNSDEALSYARRIADDDLVTQDRRRLENFVRSIPDERLGDLVKSIEITKEDEQKMQTLIFSHGEMLENVWQEFTGSPDKKERRQEEYTSQVGLDVLRRQYEATFGFYRLFSPKAYQYNEEEIGSALWEYIWEEVARECMCMVLQNNTDYAFARETPFKPAYSEIRSSFESYVYRRWQPDMESLRKRVYSPEGDEIKRYLQWRIQEIIGASRDCLRLFEEQRMNRQDLEAALDTLAAKVLFYWHVLKSQIFDFREESPYLVETPHALIGYSSPSTDQGSLINEVIANTEHFRASDISLINLPVAKIAGFQSFLKEQEDFFKDVQITAVMAASFPSAVILSHELGIPLNEAAYIKKIGFYLEDRFNSAKTPLLVEDFIFQGRTLKVVIPEVLTKLPSRGKLKLLLLSFPGDVYMEDLCQLGEEIGCSVKMLGREGDIAIFELEKI